MKRVVELMINNKYKEKVMNNTSSRIKLSFSGSVARIYRCTNLTSEELKNCSVVELLKLPNLTDLGFFAVGPILCSEVSFGSFYDRVIKHYNTIEIKACKNGYTLIEKSNPTQLKGVYVLEFFDDAKWSCEPFDIWGCFNPEEITIDCFNIAGRLCLKLADSAYKHRSLNFQSFNEGKRVGQIAYINNGINGFVIENQGEHLMFDLFAKSIRRKQISNLESLTAYTRGGGFAIIKHHIHSKFGHSLVACEVMLSEDMCVEWVNKIDAWREVKTSDDRLECTGDKVDGADELSLIYGTIAKMLN